MHSTPGSGENLCEPVKLSGESSNAATHTFTLPIPNSSPLFSSSLQTASASRVSRCLWRMGSNCAEKIPSNHSTESSEPTIEIKIKTLDSQTYTLKVDKQMPVPALKEQIASLTGVLSEQQRLICQGKVLKDDQLLSAYHVEDGHTLHLVARQPNLTPLGSLPNHSATEPNLNTSHGHSTQVAPGVFVETFNMPVQNQNEGIPPEINRIVSAVLGSIGLSNFTTGGEGIVVREHNSQGLGRTSGSIDISDSSHPQPDQAGLRFPLDRLRNLFGPSAAVTLESLQPPVIPDSLTTLSQYLSHMSQEFDAIVREVGNNVQTAEAHRSEEMGSASRMGSVPESLPSPASLAEVLLSTRQMITQQAGECILQLARQLENQADVTDPLLRSSTQSRALRTGMLFYNLGALLLELGRTTMTLRLGQAPSEAVVNGGPAVFISPTGPSHIMVQPLPFQPGASFGAVPVGAAQSNSSLGSGLGSSLGSGLGSSFIPRRIDIQIRRGSSTTPNANQEERGDTQSASGQRNAGENSVNQATSRVAGESGVRIVPIRSMVATIPGALGRPSSEPSGNSIGLYYPVLGRFQHASSGQANNEVGPQSASQHHTAQHLTPESTLQRQSTDSTRNGTSSTPDTRQEPSNTRVVHINIMTAGAPQNNQESERQLPSSVLQFFRTLFPGGEIHVEDSSLQGTNAGSTSEHAATSRDAAQVPEAEPTVSNEGIFLSNILREIMPVISQQIGSEGNPSEEQLPREVETNAGTSRSHTGSESTDPNPKRRKME